MADVDYDAWADCVSDGVARYLPDTPRPFVLDCACGTGSITVRLAKRGWKLVGSDVSPDMLRIAQNKARTNGLTIPFVEQDMRRLCAHKPADVVTACCDGLNYLASLDDVEAFFRAAHRALKPNGLLLFDISSAYKLSHVLDGSTFGEIADDLCYIWQTVYDEKTRLAEMTLAFFVREGTLFRRYDETHIQRAHTRQEIDVLLETCGFTVLSCCDAFSADPPKADSERIQWIVRRSN